MNTSALITYSLLLIPSLTALAGGGSATASDVALNGGMSFIDGTFITACLMGIAAIISACGGVIWANKRWEKKAQRPVDTDDTYMTHGECRQHRCALEKRIDGLGPALERIFKKLSENDAKSEQRSIHSNERIDLAIQSIYETKGRVDGLENRIRDAANASTVGGHK